MVGLNALQHLQFMSLHIHLQQEINICRSAGTTEGFAAHLADLAPYCSQPLHTKALQEQAAACCCSAMQRNV